MAAIAMARPAGGIQTEFAENREYSELMTPDARVVADIFRLLARFRDSYDEAILGDIARMLRKRMSEALADRVLSDAMLVDNELRFRLPRRLEFSEPGDPMASSGEDALVTLVGMARHPGDPIAVAAAEKLGIDNHHVLRQAASLLARSLARAGVTIGWGLAPVMMVRPMGGMPVGWT